MTSNAKEEMRHTFQTLRYKMTLNEEKSSSDLISLKKQQYQHGLKARTNFFSTTTISI